MSISAKITALVVATVLCLVLALSLTGYVLISRSGNESAARYLSISQQAMQDNVDAMLDAQVLAGRMMAENAPLARAVFNGDAAAARAIAKKLVDETDIDFVTICDMSGKVLARGHSDKHGDMMAENRLSISVPLRQGKHIVGIEPGTEVRLTLASGVPVMHDGKQVGAAALGVNLTSGAFVGKIKQAMGVESTIFLDDVRVSTTVMRDGKPVIDTKLNNDTIYNAVIKRGEKVTTQNDIAGVKFDTVYWPWKNMEGENGGILFVGLSRASIDATQRTAILLFLGAGALIGLLMIGGGVICARALSRPLRQATAYAEAVAGGNFDSTLDITSKDEVGALSRSLGSMVENLKAKISEADERSLEAAEAARKSQTAMGEAQEAKDRAEAGQRAILSAAEEVEEVVTQLMASADNLNYQITAASRNAEVQREQVTGCATAMEEMNSTVLEVARNAGVAAEGSANAREKAVSGAEVVKDSVRALSRVREETNTLRTAMGELGEEAENIGKVITVINDIADQTNLLALNAAIEAARAGDAGRGFAVVADEVRKLAEKTVDATTEVSAAIFSIQQGTHKSIESVDRTGGNLVTASELADKSGQSLAEIVEEAVTTADQVHSIATAAEEQSATSDEITRSLEEINRNSGDTAEVMRQSSAAVADLAVQVQRLQELVLNLRKA